MQNRDNTYNQLQVPNGYFDTVEDTVINKYYKYRRGKRIKYIMSGVGVVLIFVFFVAFYNIITTNKIDTVADNIVKTELKKPVEMLKNNEIHNVNEQVTTHEDILKKQSKQLLQQNQQDKFSESELAYLEDYITEDIYEYLNY